MVAWSAPRCIVQFNEPGTSADGHEISFATNTLGFFALTSLLAPVLERSAPSRVINVSSGGMYLGTPSTRILRGSGVTTAVLIEPIETVGLHGIACVLCEGHAAHVR